MFSIKSLVLSGVLLAGLAAPVALTASAAAEDGSCTVGAAQPKVGQPIEGRKFTTKGNRIYIKVVVKGKNCAKTVTMESWKAPNPTTGKPYKDQVLFRHVTKTFGAGEHLMSVQLPNCFYQVDLIKGSKTMGANGEIKFDASKMIGSAHGGTQKCTPTTPDTPEQPEEPETPDTPVTTVSSNKPTTLTKTGPGAVVAGLFGGVTTLGTAAHYFVRRKLNV